MENPHAVRFYNASFTLLLVTCALMPLLFLPTSWGSFGGVKQALLSIGVLLSVTAWIISQFVEGTMTFPKHRVLLGLFVAAGLSLIACLFSPNLSLSLWGKIFSLDSFATVALLALVTFLVSLFAREQKRLVKLFLTMFFVSAGTVLVQILFFLGKNTPIIANHFSTIASQGTLVGTWIDFTFFTSFAFILSLLMVEVLAPKGIFRTLGIAGVVVSLFGLVFLNLGTAWLFAVVSALLIFVYKSSVERTLVTPFSEGELVIEKRSRFPAVSFITLLVGLFFLLVGPSLGTSISRFAGVSFSDIRPSLSGTLAIAKPALHKDPFFGIGPARFAQAWDQYKLKDINSTIFWNTSFDNGYSTFTTFLVSNGPLVTLALIVSLVLALVYGFRLFGYQYPDRFTRFIAVSSLIITIPFIALLFIDVPSVVLMFYGFVFVGILVGVSVLVGQTKIVTFHYLKDPRSSFFIILVLVLTSLATLSGAYAASTRFVSTIFYNRAAAAPDVDTGITRTVKALTFASSDAYWRNLAGLYVSKFSTAAAATTPDQVALQQYFSQAEASAQGAIQYDSTNAVNWFTLGQVYKAVAATDAKDAYKNAETAFNKAMALSPTNPSYPLAFASLIATQKDTTGINDSISQAIVLKPNYLDAYVFRAQLKQNAGDILGARDAIKTYTDQYPYDDAGFYALGTAEVALKDYQAALDAFGRARTLNPNNLDAELKYVAVFETMGEKDKAITELQSLQAKYPNLTGIQAEIDRLNSNVPATPTPAPTSTTKPVKK